MAKVEPEFTEDMAEKDPQDNGDGASQTQDPENQQEEQVASEDEWVKEREDLVNQILRLKADFDNYKRRNQAAIENVQATANENLVNDLLPVIDNFDRSLQSAEADSLFGTGVKMIFNQLLKCLGEYGLDAIDAVGKTFDPNLHEAVSMEGESEENLVVMTELQKGYLFKGKLLRASMVQVAPAEQQKEEE